MALKPPSADMNQKMPSADEVNLLLAFDELTRFAQEVIKVTPQLYTSCLISHLLSFSACEKDPQASVESVIKVIRERAAGPGFRQACAYQREVP